MALTEDLQQRLWFLDQLAHAAGAAYHMASGWRLQGSLIQVALRAALDTIVARHAVLRTSAPVAVLTQAAVRGDLPALHVPVVVLELQDRASMIAREPKHNPDAPASGLHPATSPM